MNSIVLAGGQSRRMGRDKAFLPVGEKFMLQHIIDCLRPISDDIIVVTNHAWKVDGLRVQAVPDIVQEWGPLGGILSGLMASSSQYNLVVACDMPLLNRSVLTYIQVLRDGYDAVVPSVEGMLHPL